MEVITETTGMTFFRDEKGCLRMIQNRYLRERPNNYTAFVDKVPDGGPLTLKDDLSDEAYLAVFGPDRGKPYPFNEIVDGKRYSTETAQFICRYVRTVVGYEPNYRKWKKYGGRIHKCTGELFRTTKGTWFALEALGSLAVSLKRNMDEDDVKKIIETTIPARYEEFFNVEEA